MLKLKILIISLLVGIGFIPLTAQAAPILLNSSLQCSMGNSINGIVVGDVTGNTGGATDCWGTWDGNDPGPSGDGFQIGSTIFDFVAKQNTPGSLEGDDIGLIIDPIDPADYFGTWEYDPNKFDHSEFLIVLKAANSPGFAAWLFTGNDANSTEGDWSVAWTNKSGKPPALSHIGFYAPSNSNGSSTGSSNGTGPAVSEPNILALIGFGLLAGAVSKRRKKA